MKEEYLKKIWKQEEEIAHIQGWDFSHIYGRYEEEKDLPWDYDTGGGEFAPTEIFRLLRKNGVFITEQVGRDNERDLKS